MSPLASMADVRLARYDLPDDLDELLKYCEIYAKSDLVPPFLHGRVENVFVMMQMAKSLDISGWNAINGVWRDPNGRPKPYVSLAYALAERAGYTIRVLDADDPAKILKQGYASVELTKPGKIPFIASYYMREARVHGLTDLDHWQRNPVAMLVIRAIGRVINWGAPGVTLGMTIVPDTIEMEQGGLPAADDSYGSMGVSTGGSAAPENVKSAAQVAIEIAEKMRKVRTPASLKKYWENAPESTRDIVLTDPFDNLTLRAYYDRRIREVEPVVADAATGEPIEIEPDSADQAILPCGCPTESVVATGEHLGDCPKSAAPTLPVSAKKAGGRTRK